MEINSLLIMIAIITLYIFIAAFFLSIYMPKRKKRMKQGKMVRLVTLNKRLMSIRDPKELEEALSNLTDEQLQEHEKQIERDKYKIDDLGYYLRDRFDEMKPGNYKRDFILEIVNKFRLVKQFNYKAHKGEIK